MSQMKEILDDTLRSIRNDGLYKTERLITTPQRVAIEVGDGKEVLNFCANNYLGLADDPRIAKAATAAIERYGFGMASVRFICGTQGIHRELEEKIASFLSFDDAILYTSCFDANAGLFETLLTKDDAVLSDALNHASVIDGIRLCKAARFRYRHSDMPDLEEKLQEAQGSRLRLIATDGVFSMDGDIAKLAEIVALARKYDALVMVDDSHATGVIGASGRGSPEHCGVVGEIDILTSTLGKALGGASGGFTVASREVVELLRQRSRPYLFSNSLPPPLVGAALEVFDILSSSTKRRDRLAENTEYFRRRMTEVGFAIKPGEHPIVPIMLGEAQLAQTMAAELLEEGIYVIGFFYPVVPQGEARIRVQLCASHERQHIDAAIAAFERVGQRLGVV